MQQRLLSPKLHRVGRFVEVRAWSQEAVERTKTPLICAQLAHGVAEAPDKGCGTDILLPRVGVRGGI